LVDVTEQLRFDDRVAVITGGGGSIGGAYARMLAARGAKVVVADSPTPAGEEKAAAVVAAIAEAGGYAVAANHDVVEESAAIVSKALDTWGKLDIVVVNAGAAGGGEISDIPVADFEDVVAVNLYGATRLLHHAWPYLRIRGGSVLLTASGAVFGLRYVSPYSTSKAAMLGLGRTLAMDGERYGIRTNVVLPISAGGMMSDFPDSDEFNAMVKRYYTADTVASVAVWLLHEGTAANGHAYVAGGGFAGRVALAMNFGWGHPGATPEEYREHEQEIVSYGNGVFIPADAGEDANWRSDRSFGWHADSPFLH
jgi:NAD(P)-dependent dehydrogenase (short-subunit alcohol dehydrogenase family)